ncbi:hypothetical protein PTSG_04563 [Salpingoeca rosetta]|uniref:HVA22/TB2/DP1 family protein n=1 Tax=Salpingoeca rosetta (strain ATCC 50818 / BSB-021) TaxID=946362 RepID=F2U7S9_SALR5|nr:uncharacterized protein PTSG_04563 [Salpingoeca rosetta]EGD72834.1 hypothetical protein PTSG_04563 [Salpingoeca rosetta]|eukprot:XP_004994657.1 hypothetical protein PTSG_04563 [Salpingoeca rosetta]
MLTILVPSLTLHLPLPITPDTLVSWLPLYYLLKLLVLAACMYPDRKRNLSHILYYSLIRPYLLKKQSIVDSGMRASANAFRNAAKVVDDAAAKRD